jgi:hypothetical protein
VTASSGGERRTTRAEENSNQLRGEKAPGCREFHPDVVDVSTKPEEARRRRD